MTQLSIKPRFERLDERIVPSFGSPVNYPVQSGAHALLAADVTGDGNTDLITRPGSSGVGVLVGNGDGTFQPIRTTAAIASNSIATGDFNEDGKADVIAVNSTRLGVLISNGDGTFQAAQQITLPSQAADDFGTPIPQVPFAAVVGDLNEDGHLDLVAIGSTSGTSRSGPGPYGGYYYYSWSFSTVNVLLGTGEGTFGPAATSPGGNGYSPRLGIGDTNGDGNTDVILYSYWTYPGMEIGTSLTTLLGNGDGTFPNTRHSSGSNFAPMNRGELMVADFNADGKLDVMMRSSGSSQAIAVLGNGDGTFAQTAPTNFHIGWPVDAAAIGDVNRDGAVDVVVATQQSVYGGPQGQVTATDRWAQIVLGKGNGTFAQPATADLRTIAGNAYFNTAVLADFDGNGSPDLAVADSYLGVLVALNTAGEQPPKLRITDATRIEGNSATAAMTVTVTLSSASTQPVTVQFATQDVTTTAGVDYQSTAGTVTFAPGETTRTITIAVIGDRIAESNETFFVNLSSPTNATIADGQAVGTITDDEPRISINDVSKLEGKRGNTTLFTFTVSLPVAYDQAVSMSFKTTNGTAKTSNNDYVAKSGTITFAPGETTKTITIEVIGDNKRESNEVFYLDLFNTSGNSLFTRNRGVGTILNDDDFRM